jgi:hypothetical protein
MWRRTLMKVDELRTIIAAYDQEVVRKLVVELYKTIPKKEREAAALDELIRGFSETGRIARKPKAEKDLITDFADLEADTLQLIEYAALDYYYAPNRVVPKSARSKWRFTVRKMLKSLIAVKGEHSDDAALLLVELYRMLSHACAYYIFSTEAPFSAVGFTQTELLEIILSKLFSGGPTRELIRLAVYVVLESHVKRTQGRFKAFKYRVYLRAPKRRDRSACYRRRLIEADIQCDMAKTSLLKVSEELPQCTQYIAGGEFSLARMQ